eukprot:TRINITY_DN179935_c0_g1_i1.p2 TRINITY_DN179935_c0_g1~~TRINITY_DN179935_c0_g1_i1.p2  ORF type:complete len:133 (-),score=6.19 TRINITY_DN179935_c0_g1_i1:24-422(-)
MVGKATLAACEWIKANYPVKCQYLLSGNMDTDKKHSHLNMLHSRGKRVIAEIVLKKEVLARVMKVDTKVLAGATVLANTGALMAGAAYNGPHSANGIASLYKNGNKIEKQQKKRKSKRQKTEQKIRMQQQSK